MTQIVRAGVPEDGPRSHALVIGVGHYRHFKGGAEDNKRLAIRGEQLSSPPVSAVAFADWLLGPPGTGYHPPVAPLATVDLLLSASDPAIRSYHRPDTETDTVVEVETATHANVKAAFKRWRELLNVRPDDVGLFFFSGHGLKRINHVLLLEDFGADHDAPFEGAFDFDTTWVAMERCAARQQYFFVDACQSLMPRAMRNKMLSDQARPLWEPEYAEHESARKGGVFRGAAASTKAYGRENEVSHFTTAVLNGLRGLGSDRNAQGLWVVRSGKLMMSIGEELEYLRQKGEAPEQDPRGDAISTEPVHVVGKEPPEVPYVVWCSPEKAHALARLSVRHGEAEVCARPLPVADRWEVKLKPRTYKLGAVFDEGHPYDAFEDEITVQTPRGSRELPIARRP